MEFFERKLKEKLLRTMAECQLRQFGHVRKRPIEALLKIGN